MSAVTAPVAGGNRPLPEHEGGPGRRVLSALLSPGGAVYLLVLVLLVAIMVSNPNFADPNALIRFAGRTAPIAIAAMGQYFVIVSGEFDLSMAAVITAQVVLAGNFIGQDESRILPGLMLMVAVGVLIGVINGLATTLLRVPSFIVTLGMMLSLTGLVRYVTGGAATGNPSESFREVGRGGIRNVPIVGIVPYSLLVLLVVATLAVWLMRRPFGRSLIAAGDNPASARYSGTSLWWIKTRAFILSALSATVAAILLVGYAGVHPSVGAGYEFAAITAVVLGGVVLGGGRGWVLSAAAGAFALELLFVLLTSLGIPSTWRDTVQGLIIIAAVALAGRAWQGALRLRGSRGAPTIPPQPIQPAQGATTGEN